MRIIKLSPNDKMMLNRKMVDRFFLKTLPEERRGQFRFPKGFIAKEEFRPDENIVFSYNKEIVFLASAKSGVLDLPDDPYERKYIELDISSIRRGRGSLEELERKLQEMGVLYNQNKSGSKIPKTILSKGWPKIHVPEKDDENDLMKLFELKEDEHPATIQDEDEESQFSEGKREYHIHQTLERDSAIAKKAKKQRLFKQGELRCDVCNFSFFETYGEHGKWYIEAHHTTPVSELGGTRKTKISEIALLCSNCHKSIHRSKPILSVSALREIVISNRKNVPTQPT